MRMLMVGLAISCVMAWGLYAEVIKDTLEFDTSEITTEIIHATFSECENDTWLLATLPGCFYIQTECGRPVLPSIPLKFCIPNDSKVDSVVVDSLAASMLGLDYMIFPSQPPYEWRIGALPPDTCPPDSATYQSSDPYPGYYTEFSKLDYHHGFKVATCFAYPVQYIPDDSLRLATYLEISVHYSTSTDWSWPLEKMTSIDYEDCKGSIKEVVVNPGDVEGFGPNPSIIPPHEAIRHVIIADDCMKGSLQDLADWHTRRGMNCRVQGLDSIVDSCAGDSVWEKVRSFIRHHYRQSGLRYVLLASDSVEGVAFGNEVASDLYFANLDWTWDPDGDGIYGYSLDTLVSPDGYRDKEGGVIDYGADVHVGRTFITDSSQADTFVSRVLEYEQNPSGFYSRDCLLLGAVGRQHGTDVSGGIIQDSITVELPAGLTYTWLYDSLYSGSHEPTNRISRYNTLVELQRGYRFISHAGHGLPQEIDVSATAGEYLAETERIYNVDLDALANQGKGLFSSMGCVTGDWQAGDTVCFGEHWVSNDSGSGTLYFGCGSASYYEVSYTSTLIPFLNRKVFGCLGQGPAGKALSEGKLRYPMRRYRRWDAPTIAEFNLFGDPSVWIRMKKPGALDATHLNWITANGTRTVNVYVEDSVAVEGACVCLHLPNCSGFPKVEYTDASGNATFYPVRACWSWSGDNTMFVTATKPGYIPYLGDMEVRRGCPYVLAWDGSEYVEDNNIIPPDTRDTTGGDPDGVDYYKLERAIVVKKTPQGDQYHLNIREYDSHVHTYLNQVRLVVVDHPKGTQVLADGDEVVLFQQSSAPTSCEDEDGNDCLALIEEMGDGEYFDGEEGDTLYIDHPIPGYKTYHHYCTAVKKPYTSSSGHCISVEVETDTGWVAVDTLHPRENWSATPIDLSCCVDTSLDSVRTRLSWSEYHELDYVGVLSPVDCQVYPQLCDVDTFECTLLEAGHCLHGSVKDSLLYVDSLYVQVDGGEKVGLVFSAPQGPSKQKVRDFILITTGYYTTDGGPQAIEGIHRIPPVYFLSHGYPNPFLSNTSIRYGTPRKTELSIKVYDASGRLVRNLVEGHVEAGYHRLSWKGDDSRGRQLPSGTYFIRMESEDFRSTRKVVLVR